MTYVGPSKEPIQHILEIGAQSVEGIDYGVEQIKRKINQGKERFPELEKGLDLYAEQVKLKLTAANQSWTGKLPEESDFKNLQANIANQALKSLDSALKGNKHLIVFEFAISKNAQFLRGYSSSGKELDAESVGKMDKAYIAWLSKNNMVGKDGIVYQGDGQDKIKEDEQGQQVQANPDQVRALITDPEKGLAAYLATNGIKVICQEQHYPEPQVQEQVSMGGA